MHRIAVISDTHNLLRPEVLEIIKTCEVIVHGGDISTPDILERLRQMKPLYIVRGNNDRGDWASDLPHVLHFDLFGRSVCMTHIKRNIPQDPDADLVIYGHSHRYSCTPDGETLFLNPGSCGPRRFNQEITMAILTLFDEGEAFTIPDSCAVDTGSSATGICAEKAADTGSSATGNCAEKAADTGSSATGNCAEKAADTGSSATGICAEKAADTGSSATGICAKDRAGRDMYIERIDIPHEVPAGKGGGRGAQDMKNVLRTTLGVKTSGSSQNSQSSRSGQNSWSSSHAYKRTVTTDLVRRVCEDVDREKTIQEIAARRRIDPELAEQIVRMYLTHQKVTPDQIMTKLGL